jgi:hypothetical protein
VPPAAFAVKVTDVPAVAGEDVGVMVETVGAVGAALTVRVMNVVAVAPVASVMVRVTV